MDDLQKLVDEAMARFNSLTPEQQTAHRQAQRESWVRGEMQMTKDFREGKSERD